MKRAWSWLVGAALGAAIPATTMAQEDRTAYGPTRAPVVYPGAKARPAAPTPVAAPTSHPVVQATADMAEAPIAYALTDGHLPAPGTCADGACSDAACPSCQARRRSGVLGGASLYYLRPYFQNNPAFSTTTGLGTASASTITNDFTWNFEPGWAAWIGYVADGGLGVRGRYFRFDQSSDSLALGFPTTPGAAATTAISGPAGVDVPGGLIFGSPGLVLPPATETFTFDSDLYIESADAELIFARDHGNWRFLLGGGARYLRLTQSYLGTLSNAPAPGVLESQTLGIGSNFRGFGPTASAQANVQVGKTGLSLFGLARGSLLIGRQRREVALSQSIVDPTALFGGSQSAFSSTSERHDGTLPMVEFELGVEYGRHFGKTYGFVRAAAVNQTYFDAGSASQSDGNLSLFGGQLSVGVNY